MDGKPRFILSDCDGVIVDSETIAESVVIEVFTEVFGREAVEMELDNCFGIRVTDILSNLERKYRRVVAEDSRQALLAQIDHLVAERAPAMNMVKETYSRLGLPIAIVSNSSPERIRKSIDAAGLTDLVGDHYFSGDQVQNPKPAPDVYLAAVASFGTEPRHCLAIEDSEAGVRAAVAANIPVLGFLGGKHIRPGHGDVLKQLGAFAVIENFLQLESLLLAPTNS